MEDVFDEEAEGGFEVVEDVFVEGALRWLRNVMPKLFTMSLMTKEKRDYLDFKGGEEKKKDGFITVRKLDKLPAASKDGDTEVGDAEAAAEDIYDEPADLVDGDEVVGATEADSDWLIDIEDTIEQIIDESTLTLKTKVWICFSLYFYNYSIKRGFERIFILSNILLIYFLY